MAEASLSFVEGIGPWHDGKFRKAIVDWTAPASYSAGGLTVDGLSRAGMNKILGVKKLGGNAAAANYLVHWDTVNQKLMICYPTGGAAASPAALADPVQGAMTIEDHAADQIGTIPSGATPVVSSAADGAIVTISAPDSHVVSAVGSGVPGRGKELAASTNASALTFRLELIGV